MNLYLCHDLECAGRTVGIVPMLGIGFHSLIDGVIRLDLRMGTSVFPFEEVQDALILARQGKLEQPNAVVKIAGSP